DLAALDREAQPLRQGLRGILGQEAVDLVLVVEVIADRVVHARRREVRIRSDDVRRLFASLEQPGDERDADARAGNDRLAPSATRPPCASTSARTTDSPIPLPRTDSVLAAPR